MVSKKEKNTWMLVKSSCSQKSYTTVSQTISDVEPDLCAPPHPAQSAGNWYRVLLSMPSIQLVSCDLPPKLDNNHTDKYLILQSPLMTYLNVVEMLICYKSFQVLFLNFYTFHGLVEWRSAWTRLWNGSGSSLKAWLTQGVDYHHSTC